MRRCMLLLVLLFVSAGDVRAQLFGHGLSDTHLEMNAGEILTLNLYLEKTDDEGLETIDYEVVTDKPLQLLTKAKQKINFGSEERVYQSVKLFVPKYIASDTTYNIAIVYRSGGNIVGTDSCQISIKEVKLVNIFPGTQTNSIDKTTEMLRVPVRIINAGNTYQEVTVIARMPEIKSSDFFKVLQTELPPFLDTTVYFEKKVLKEMFKHSEFEVNFTGLYKDGNIFGGVVINVQVAGSKRSYIGNRPLYKEADGTPDAMTLAARYLRTPFENYQLFGGSSLQFKKSMLVYSADITMWRNGYIQPLVRNTFVTYEKNNSGVTIGNIQRNYELNLNGKGASVFHESKDHHNRLEAGYILAGYNLINNDKIANFNQGQSAWLNFNRHKNRFHMKASYLYDVSAFSFTRSNIANTEFGWTGVHSNLTLTGAAGLAQDTRGSAADTPGFAGGVVYSQGFGKFYFNSNNFASTAHYPGYRRGAVTSDNRLSLVIKNVNSVWLSYSYFNFEPALIPGAPNSIAAIYGTSRAMVGSDIKLSNSISVGLMGISNNEVNNYGAIFGLNESSTMSSLRGELSLRYSNPQLQCYGTLTSENGTYATSVYAGQRTFHSKSVFSFRYKFINMSAMYQHGFFYLTEVLNSVRYNTGQYSLLTISPMLQKDFMHKKLEVMAGVTYSANSIFGKNTMANIRIDYFISKRVKAYNLTTLNRFELNGNVSNVNNIEMGAVVALKPQQLTAFIGSALEVSVMLDMNGNGVYDPGDRPSPNRMVNINGTILMTDNLGNVRLTHIPDSLFNIQVSPDIEWYAPQQTIQVNGNTRVIILMQKASKISGNINYKFDEFSYEVKKKMDGVAIVATSANNEKYFTKTDEHGKFIFYLPEGTFTLNVQKEQLGREVECVNDNMIVSVKTDNTADVELLLKVKDRKVQVKKFGSYSMNTERKK